MASSGRAPAPFARPEAHVFGTLERFAQRPAPYAFDRDRDAYQLVEAAWSVVSERGMLEQAQRTRGGDVELLRDCEQRWVTAIQGFARYATPRFPTTLARVSSQPPLQQQGFLAALPFAVFAVAARRGDVDWVVNSHALTASARELLVCRNGSMALDILSDADLEAEVDWLNGVLAATTAVVSPTPAALN